MCRTPYCCAIDIHSPIDALAKVVAAHDLRAHDIAQIVVPEARIMELHSGTIVEPHDITGAQLSLHYSLGLTVVSPSSQTP